jgi:hypothetical protein
MLERGQPMNKYIIPKTSNVRFTFGFGITFIDLGIGVLFALPGIILLINFFPVPTFHRVLLIIIS